MDKTKIVQLYGKKKAGMMCYCFNYFSFHFVRYFIKMVYEIYKNVNNFHQKLKVKEKYAFFL